VEAEFGTAIEDTQYHLVETPIQNDGHIAHSVLYNAPLPSRLMDLSWIPGKMKVGERGLPPCHCGT
jgi:hypothetical protein